MASILSSVLGWAGVGVALVGNFCMLTGRDKAVEFGFYAVGSWLVYFANIIDFSLGWAVVFGAIAVLCTYAWWKNRRKGRGKKALKQIGAKSRARVQALVRQMTPSPIPSPAGGRA
jgi:hypothetical protein